MLEHIGFGLIGGALLGLVLIRSVRPIISPHEYPLPIAMLITGVFFVLS